MPRKPKQNLRGPLPFSYIDPLTTRCIYTALKIDSFAHRGAKILIIVTTEATMEFEYRVPDARKFEFNSVPKLNVR